MQLRYSFFFDCLDQDFQQLCTVYRKLLHLNLIEIRSDCNNFLAIVPTPHRPMDLIPPSRNRINLLAEAKSMQDLGCIDGNADASTDF